MSKLELAPIANLNVAGLATINQNMDDIEGAVENTLSRDGSTPNQMEADIDLNDNDLINVNNITADEGRFGTLTVGGVVFTGGEGFSVDPCTPFYIEMTLQQITELGIDPVAYIQQDDGTYWVNDSQPMRPCQFGTGLASVQAAFNHAAIMDRIVEFDPAETYTGTTGSTLSIPTGSHWTGDLNLVFTDPAPTGTANGTTIVTAGDDVRGGTIFVTEPGGASSVTSSYIIVIGNRPDIDCVRVESVAQRQKSGVRWDAEMIRGHLGKVISRRCDRPLGINNLEFDSDTQEWVAGPTGRANTAVLLGDLDFDLYRTGFRPAFINFTAYGDVTVRGRSSYASKEPGANGILMQGCGRMNFLTPPFIANACEHAVRIGNPETEVEEDTTEYHLHMPWLYVVSIGGCALKCTQKATTFSEIVVGGITGTNVGCETFGHGEEMVRLAKMDNVQIGPIYSYKTDGLYWEDYVHPNTGVVSDLPNVFPRAAVQMQDCSNFSIGPIYGGYRQMFVDFYGESDYGSTSPGPVTDGYILIGNAVTEGGSAVRFYSSPALNGQGNPIDPMTVGNVDIEFAGARGWTSSLYTFGRPAPTDDFVEITNPIRFFGYIAGTVGPYNDSDETGIGHDLITINVDWLGRVRRGKGQALSRTASRGDQNEEIVAETTNTFNSGDFYPTSRVINHKLFTAGSGNYGMPVAEVTQLSTHRRGGAITPRQTGSNSQDIGWEFWGGPSSGSTNALRLILALKHTGTLAAARLSVYADNAAAVSGGLVAGDIYRTSTGEVRIVV